MRPGLILAAAALATAACSAGTSEACPPTATAKALPQVVTVTTTAVPRPSSTLKHNDQDEIEANWNGAETKYLRLMHQLLDSNSIPPTPHSDTYLVVMAYENCNDLRYNQRTIEQEATLVSQHTGLTVLQAEYIITAGVTFLCPDLQPPDAATPTTTGGS